MNAKSKNTDPDMDKLREYRNKRDFSKTAEPSGGKSGKSDQPIFVIQQHDAQNLHFDFRLEIDGVLKSWAVPKGPSTDPAVKRMAINTEDHPMEYKDFEGIIPEDEYGGGTVIVWDGGVYENIREKKDEDKKNMQESFDEGKIEVDLHGKKVEGGFVLIRTGDKTSNKWILKKMKDDKADKRRKPAKTQDKSILSGKTLAEIRKEMEEQ